MENTNIIRFIDCAENSFVRVYHNPQMGENPYNLVFDLEGRIKNMDWFREQDIKSIIEKMLGKRCCQCNENKRRCWKIAKGEKIIYNDWKIKCG